MQLTLSSEPHSRDMPKELAFLNNANGLYTVDISYNLFFSLRKIHIDFESLSTISVQSTILEKEPVSGKG